MLALHPPYAQALLSLFAPHVEESAFQRRAAGRPANRRAMLAAAPAARFV